MKKILIVLALLSLTLLCSCNLIDPDSNKDFTITTDRESYTVQNKFSAKVLFKNELGREVSIMYSGCSDPSFETERLEDDKWITAGGPVCAALAVPPRSLREGRIYIATVKMYAENDLTSGTYRMKFDIRNEAYGEEIGPKHLYSNSFEIVRE